MYRACLVLFLVYLVVLPLIACTEQHKGQDGDTPPITFTFGLNEGLDGNTKFSQTGQEGDEAEVMRDRIEACGRAWNRRDRVYLSTQCFEEGISMIEPPPLPSVTLEGYLLNYDETIHAMPDASMHIYNISIDRDTQGFAFEWSFSATFAEEASLNQFIGRGQHIHYTALAVGTYHMGLMRSIRNYYSIAQVLRLFTHPSSPSSTIAKIMPLEGEEEINRGRVEGNLHRAEEVKKTCTELVRNMYSFNSLKQTKKKKGGSISSMVVEGVVLNRAAPWESVVGRDVLIQHLQESVKAVEDIKVSISSLIVDGERCVVEYSLSGTFAGNKIWGIKLPRSVEGGSREFKGGLTILTGRDISQQGKVMVHRIDDYFDPFHFADSHGSAIPDELWLPYEKKKD